MPSSQLRTLMTVFRASPKRRVADIERMRRDFEAFVATLPRPEDLVVRPEEELRTPGGHPVEAEWVERSGVPPEGEGAETRTILFFHGGGYASGSLVSHRALAGRLAGAGRARCLSVAYRLAPEHPFPAALDDARAAWELLVHDRGVDPGHLVLAGDSAGGGLALALAHDRRDAGDAPPAALVLLSPWTDLSITGASVEERADDDPFFDRTSLEQMATIYRAGTPADDPRLSPLFGRHEGLPPVHLQVGTREVMLDDSRRLAERLERAGVDVELDVWEGLFHGWQLFAGMLPEADEALERLGEVVRRHTPVAAGLAS